MPLQARGVGGVAFWGPWARGTRAAAQRSLCLGRSMLAAVALTAFVPHDEQPLVAEPRSAKLRGKPSAYAEPKRKAKTGPIPLMSLAAINRYYETGMPSNDLSGSKPAGLVVHMQDGTEQYGSGRVFQPGDVQFQEFWPASIVTVQMPGLYTYECGLIVNPEAATVMCSSDHDMSSWNFGCKQAGLFPPDQLEAMLNSSLHKQQSGHWSSKFE